MSMQERSMRSVFVGNIPYEATEEQLKEIFSEAGPVLSFRLVYDRENGKPKGYGFCEYRDADTALSAMRNLNGYELNGRAIRVDTAASEKNKEELKNLQMSLNGPPTESPYGGECDPDRAPEVISRAVASLPPEQMYELMKQMKQCIQNNPNEARNMLLQNPQLAYALLQGQVAMKIIDPQTAMTMLHRPNQEIKPLLPSSGSYDGPAINQVPATAMGGPSGPGHIPRSNFDGPPFGGVAPSGPIQNPPRSALLGDRPSHGPPFGDPRGPAPRDFDLRDQRGDFEGDRVGMPLRNADPRNSRDNRDIRDHRMIPPEPDMHGPGFDPRSRGMPVRGPREFEQRMGPMYEPRDQPVPPPPPPARDQPPFNVRSPLYDERQGADGRSPIVNSTAAAQPPSAVAVAAAAAASAGAARPTQDTEKAELIMQVLQLSDEQIALLPPEQRQSIMVLKEQIARSARN
ncbi:Cleavage stimulation factor subunit 2 [Chamberlinius hualienensis]